MTDEEEVGSAVEFRAWRGGEGRVLGIRRELAGLLVRETWIGREKGEVRAGEGSHWKERVVCGLREKGKGRGDDSGKRGAMCRDRRDEKVGLAS